MAYYSNRMRTIWGYNMGRGDDRILLTPKRPACAPKWLSNTILVILILSVVALLLFVFQPLKNEINVLLIDIDGPIQHQTNERFLSLALDSSLIAENFLGFDMNDKKLRKMMKPLQGGYLRIGGTLADSLTFSRERKWAISDTRYFPDLQDSDRNYTLFASDWDALNELAQYANLTIIFDLNVLKRSTSGSWDPQNARELIAYSHEKKYNIVWQLGNEPNSFKHVFNFDLPPEQLAHDFSALRILLGEFPRYGNASIVGPDVTKPKLLGEDARIYLSRFLNHLQPNVINAITWHQYYFRGPGAHLSYFLNPDIFDQLQAEIGKVKSAIPKDRFADTPIWLGETSSAYGGGAPGLSDKYAASFIWVDKLGLAARNGIDLIIRQSLFKDHYALLDDKYDPNPDWWISVVFKKLVGRKVLQSTSVGNRRLRFYCHCAQPDNGYTGRSAVVVFGMNMNFAMSYVRVQLPNSNIDDIFRIKEFVIRTHISILTKELYLNQEFLKMGRNGLPEMKSVNYTGNMITLPPYAIGFWLLEHETRSISLCD